MKRAALFLVVMAASACGSAPLGPLQVCSIESFDTSQNGCPSDERSVHSGGVICSLKVENHRGQAVSGKYFYLDEEVHHFEDTIDAENGMVTFKFQREGLALLPGGDWRCEITVAGEKLSATFVSTAEEGPILDAAVCPASDVVTDTSGICSKDDSAAGFPDTDNLTCSATTAGAKGKHVSTALYRGDTMLGESSGVTPDIQLGAYSKKYHSQLSTGFGEGDYSCRFLVDDQEAARKSFHITAR